MKKTIKSLIKKMEQTSRGKLSGGFSTVRGGKNLFELATNNGSCSNENVCSGTNNGGLIWHCNNEKNCTKTTNDYWCSNDGSCPAN